MDRFSYSINRAGQLVQLDERWQEFACANGGEKLAAQEILGKDILGFISNEITRTIYWGLFQTVRQTGHSISFAFRCDAPDLRRFTQMELWPQPNGGIQFQISTFRRERRAWVSLLDGHAPRSEASLRICSWCQKLCMEPDRWVEAEQAETEWREAQGNSLPRLQQAICRRCSAQVLRRSF